MHCIQSSIQASFTLALAASCISVSCDIRRALWEGFTATTSTTAVTTGSADPFALAKQVRRHRQLDRPCRVSERQLKSQLHQATIVHSRLDKAESRRAHIVHRRTKLRVIEEVEELRAEHQTHLSG
jgi:hypothetical protein